MTTVSTLTPEQWAAVREHFDRLVDLSPLERERHIKRLDLPQPVVMQIEGLLKAAALRGILDDGALELAGETASPASPSLTPGSVVGKFTIDRLIGRGGMGEVYLAYRSDNSFEQRVALKMLRFDAVNRGAMFEHERRLLARLEHRNIARLIDGGIAPDGRPYMAMEYVDGVPIDQFCRDSRATPEARLVLFRAICDAVSYAHAHLVIHRDLKPGNILIDGENQVRLLDFGIATLTDDLTDSPAMTQALLTPDYAAPEQLEGAATSVATDIFALGVILFELMTGAGPWQREGQSVPSIMRRILQDDPPLPSRSVVETDPPVQARKLSGDIDAIVLKAMRRQPSERYRSVADLSEDVRHHLEHKPVKARGGSTAYLTGRFIRRYRWPVAAGSALLAAILIGAGGIAWQAHQTAVERDIALAEAQRSESINRMLTVMFRETASGDAGEDATVRQMLDTTARQLVASVDTSAKSATLITTLSDLYVNMEDNRAADTLLREALAKGIGRGNPVATAEIKLRLASTSAGLGKTDEMKPLLDAAESVFAKDPARYRYEMVELNSGRAQLARRSGDVPGAIALLTKSLPDAEYVYAANHRDLLTFYNNLLVYMVEANQLEAMPAIFARADEALKRTHQENSMAGLGITQLKGMRLLKLEQPRAAEAVFTEVAAKRRALFGESAGLSVDLLQLSRAKLAQGQFEEARVILGKARPMAVQYLGATATPTLVMGLGLAEARAETGDVAGAEKILSEITSVITVRPAGLLLGLLYRDQAIVAWKQGQPDKAKTLLNDAEATFKNMGPAGESYLKPLDHLRARISGGL
ncbi:MAG: protein kinase [Asticcacaulis sp.]